MTKSSHEINKDTDTIKHIGDIFINWKMINF